MAQTPTAFDTTVLVDLDADNGMKYKMPRHGPHTPWSPIRNCRNGNHARRPSPPSDLEDSDDTLAGNVQSGATATVSLSKFTAPCNDFVMLLRLINCHIIIIIIIIITV